jgi:hypothetical protein
MERREFYLRQPMLAYVPVFVVLALFFVPLIVLLARGGPIVPTFGAGDAFAGDAFAAGFWSSFSATFALTCACSAVIVLLALGRGISAARKRPFLVLDSEALGVPGLKVLWRAIGTLTSGRNLGIPCLRVSTLNNDLLIKQMHFPLNLVYGLRVRIYGAPIFIPPLREVSREELRDLIETYRADATA